MAEIFLQLCQEVARLQELCARQGELLQKLTAGKGPVLDIPMSLPIQCTEDAVTEGGETPPGSPRECSETLRELCEAPGALRREALPSESALPAGEKQPVEIRGPVKTCWTPGWVLEDAALGPGAEAAQACDICQATFPADAADWADCLKPLFSHPK